jgi:hypothetical protein
MTIANAIKKLEKLSGKKVVVCNHSLLHSIDVNGYRIGFYPNGRLTPDVDATCFHTNKTSCNHDTFHDNISKAYNWAMRKTE